MNAFLATKYISTLMTTVNRGNYSNSPEADKVLELFTLQMLRIHSDLIVVSITPNEKWDEENEIYHCGCGRVTGQLIFQFYDQILAPPVILNGFQGHPQKQQKLPLQHHDKKPEGRFLYNHWELDSPTQQL